MNTDSPPSSFFPSLKQCIGAVILFAVVGAVVYWATLRNGFVALDDPYVIYNNLALRSITPATLRHIFTTFDPELYIPLTFLSFQVDYLIGGLHASQYHLTNLVLHIGNALLVAAIIGQLIRNKGIGIFAGLLFLVHPLNVEVVAWATARKESLSTFFALAAFLCYLRYRQTGGSAAYILSVAAFLLALLAKVTVFTLPLLLLLTDFFQGRPWQASVLKDKIPHFFLAIVFVIIGIIPKEQIFASTTLLEKILMAGKSTVFYLTKFLVPIRLSVLYPNEHAISWTSPEYPIALAIVVILLAIVLLSLKRTRSLAYGFGFFLIAIAPTFVHFNRNASIQSGTATGIQFASDHYAYLPAIGLLFLVAAAVHAAWNSAATLRKLRQTRSIIIAALSALLAVFSVLSMKQLAFWQGSEPLFAHTLSLYPYSSAARVNLAVIYRETGRFDEERRVLEDGLTYGPNSKLLAGLGAISARGNDTVRAEAYFQEATVADPTNAEPYFFRGTMLAGNGDSAGALAEYEKAISLDPQYVAAYVNKGSLLVSGGQDAAAEEQFRIALRLNSSSKEALFNLATVLGKKDELRAQATSLYEQVVALDPGLKEARLELVPLYLEQGMNTRALEQIKAILAQDPNNAAAKALLQEMVRLGIVGRK